MSRSIQQAGSVQAAPRVGQVYECVICHIHYTAAQAAKFHYRDPMAGGKPVPLKSAPPVAPVGALTARRVAVPEEFLRG